jgi:hypothetical protein
MDHQDVNDTTALLRRIEDLETQMAQMRRTARAAEDLRDQPDEETTTSRRGLLKLAGATAVGAAASTLLMAAPASAADSGNMVIGVENLEEAPTYLQYDGGASMPTDNLFTVSDYATSLVDSHDSAFPATVAGWALDGPAQTLTGVYGYTVMSNGYGTVGWGNGDATTHGVLASGTGYGIVAAGDVAQILLSPGSTPGHPTGGDHQLGEIYVDSSGTMFRCVADGTPGIWAPMYSTVPLATPHRVIDTRSAIGGIVGPLSPDTTATSFNITGGSSGIPGEAVAVVGTVTMVATGQNLPGAGFLTVFPGGSAVPTTSNVNADTGHAIASGLTVGLGNGGEVSMVASIACHALLDVSAYII